MKKKITIDITPTWAALVPWMLRVLEDPDAREEAKKPLRDELNRLARAMDAEIARTEKRKKRTA